MTDIKAEFVPPKPAVRNISLEMTEPDAALLMRYIRTNGSWVNSTGGKVAAKTYDALATLGVDEA